MQNRTIVFWGAIILLSSCTSTQIRQTLSDAKTASVAFLHENGISVRNDPARLFDPLPYRTNVPDKQLAAIPPVMANQVFLSPEETLPEVVKALITGVDDPVRKAKILHDWVVQNISYDVVSYSRREIPDQSFISILRTRKGVSEGFSNLYMKMCSLAGIQCKKVSGTARSYGFDPFRKVNMGIEHIWNSVLLKGNWYLVDTTWDSCRQKGCGECTTERKYRTDYFLFDPQLMLMTHLPDVRMWQLVANPVNKNGFLELPPLTSAFFSSVDSIQDNLKCINTVDGMTSVLYTIKPSMLLMAILINDKGQQIKGATSISQNGNNGELKLAFPKAGNYTLLLLTGDKRKGSVESTGSLYYVASRGTDVRFPEQYLF